MKPPKPSQLRAILTTDRHVLVAAGAGTGKTTTVVGRILYLLGVEIEGNRIAQPLGLQDIAAITFTNSAAADLKAKLREELRLAGLRDVAQEVDGARVGTIHGFCGDILRECALRRGASPGVRVLEEGEAWALTSDAVHDALLRALENDSVAGLDSLFEDHKVSDVEKWVARLVGETARLDRIAANRSDLGTGERALVDLALLAREELDRRLDGDGAVDFDRMITRTRDLLRDDPLVRDLLRRRIRTLIVDEFQDVDPVQKEIAYLLGDPESRRPDTTRLMLVGDPKQSIYRFRRADVTVWREVEDDFAKRGLGLVRPLEEHFRSVDAVMALVDATVGRLLDTPLDGNEHAPYEVRHLVVKAEQKVEPGDVRVELLVVAGADNVDQVRDAEAEAVARRVVELGKAKVPWKDIALIFSAWTDVPRFEAALRRLDVPTYVLRAEGFYSRREVVDLILALEAIRDPSDDLALMGFLRSPFVGLEDETLLAIAIQVKGKPYWGRLEGLELREAERLRRGVELLEELAALRDRIPPHELLETLLDRTGYLAHLVVLGPEKRQALANVRKFLRLARAMADRSVGDLLRAVNESRDREDRVEDERLYGPRENVVTLTSIHSAKGLEWDTVIWCDLMRAPPNQSEAILVGRDTIALKHRDAEEQSAEWERLEAAEKNEQRAERKRAWYVAATRAKSRLILAGLSERAKTGCPAADLLEALGTSAGELTGAQVAYEGQGGQFHAAVRVVSADGAEAEAVPAEFEPAELPEPAPPLLLARGPVAHSATSLMAYARCQRRHWFRYGLGVKEPPVDRSGPEFGSAVARGQIVHDVLERLREEAEVDELIEVAIGRWEEDAPEPGEPAGRQYRDELKTEILAAAGHPAYRTLDERPGAKRELELVRFLAEDARLQGKADLAAAEGEGIAVLDVKTGGDAASVKQRAQGYALQRGVYAAALSEIGGLPVERFAFLFSKPGMEVSAPVSDADRAEAGAEIGRMLAEMGEGVPSLTTHPWECRYCGYRAVGWCAGVPFPGKDKEEK